MPTRRMAVLPPVLVLLLGAVAACAGGAAAEGGGAPDVRASAASPSTPPGGTAPRPIVPPEDLVRAIVDARTTAGSYDFTAALGSGDGLVATAGSVHLGQRGPTMSLTMLARDSPPLDLRLVEGTTYVRLGEATGGKFVVVDAADESHPLHSVVAEPMQLADPTMGMGERADAVVGVTVTGEPFELDGVQVQSYEVVVDPSKAPGGTTALGSDAPPGDELPSTLTYEYLVDGEGRVHQLNFTNGDFRARMGFSNWGSASPVAAPTADETAGDDPFTG